MSHGARLRAQPRGPLEVLADLLYPPKCPFCGRVLDRQETEPCPQCRGTLPWTAAEDRKTVAGCEGCLAPLWYRDGVRDGIHRYKFNGGRNYAPMFGSLMAQCFQERWTRPVDVVTWAPLSQKRRKERGYDQAELLAREIGGRLGLPVKRLLEKTRNAAPQSSLEDASLRQSNIQGAYRLYPGGNCAGKRLILVDDVITTGSTLGECAAVLKEAGCVSIVALGLAWARQ